MRLSGLTFLPLTVNLGADSWIASLRDSRVSPTVSQESSADTKTSEPCGPTSSESSMRLDLTSSSSKTSRPLQSTSSPLGTSFTDWANALRLDSSRRRKSAHLTSESASSAWPTARAQDAKHGAATEYELSRPKQKDLLHVAAVRDWPIALKNVAESWATPTTRDWKDGSCQSANVEVNSLLGRQVLQGTGKESRKSLNPRFVEWLMGLPLGWTAFERVETASYLSRQRMRLASLLRGSADA